MYVCIYVSMYDVCIYMSMVIKKGSIFFSFKILRTLTKMSIICGYIVPPENNFMVVEK